MPHVNRSLIVNLVILLSLMAATGCNLPSNTPNNDNAASTAAAQTIQAQMTQSVPSIPTATFAPLVTSTMVIPTLVPTATRVYYTATSSCDIAQFITDVTFPDGTTIGAGQAFTKTWRFKNAGTCSWTPSYSIVFSSGSQMGGPDTQALAANVNPGQTVDISVNMTAPTTPGDYTGYWKLRNAAGVLFAHFYVQIKVQATVTVTVPSAQVSLNAIPAESGTVYEAAAGLAPAGTILAGDTAGNFIARGYMSFDIASLAGKTISSATLDLTSCTKMQDPFTGSLAGIWLGELQYPLPLDQSDYDLSGTAIISQPLTNIPTDPIDVKSFVQSRVNEGRARFQVRLHPKGPSDADAQADYMSCSAGSVILKITYVP
jgi:hypothetical protein